MDDTTTNIRPCWRMVSCLRKALILLPTLFLLAACNGRHHRITPQERREADSIVAQAHDVEALSKLQAQLEKDGNKLGSVVALREWGKILRDESRFEESLKVHSKGLQQAEALGDTIEWVLALNYLGTNYRRLGVMDAAQTYHFRALRLSEECDDTCWQAKKNYVKSLNGLGNIYMTLGNFGRADSVLRLALVGERQLGSDVGQAINYANLGSVAKHRGQIDSAWAYYRQSMACNRRADCKLGVALCHTAYGELYQDVKQYDKAYAEYQMAYEQLRDSKDEWHALQPLLALVKIDYITGNHNTAFENLSKAKAIAEKIKSKEHLADIYFQYYRLYERQGNYREALKQHVTASAMQDSMIDLEKMNRIQSVSLNIERHIQGEKVSKAREELASERTAKTGIIYTGTLVIVILGLLLGTLIYTGRMRKRNHLLLKKMSALRENFFTNITHEFRTPLTVILGLSQAISQDKNVPDETREKSRTIERQGTSLLTLINQLLDISKMKSAVGDPEWRNGNIVAQIAMTIESYREYARMQNINFTADLCDEVCMDFVPDYVNKVMNNLLSNAFKYTPTGGTVHVKVHTEGKRLLVDVSDTGRGIPPESIPHIFEPFYQGENDGAKIGTGVGLALVKQIIDSVHGTITVESTMGHGTVFHISVAIQQTHMPSGALKPKRPDMPLPMLPTDGELPTSADLSDDDARRVLVIDDSADVAAFIGSQLSDKYGIIYAHDGQDGLDKAEQLVPDVIVTDLMMPGIDGLEVCRRIRANEVTSHIPIIVVTAKITENDRVKGLEAGADAYLSKPFNRDELRMRVEKLLEQRRMLRDKYAKLEENDREEEQPQSDADRRFVNKVTDAVYMLLNGGSEVDVMVVAQKMGMSYSQFYRKLSALTGCTPMGYILRVKIRKARLLIDKNPAMPFRDVAERCGFSDYSNFVRAFKNVCGITPTQYVRQKE